jgi:hypothetical protein
MRRTCSGVMAVLGAGARGGVVGRSLPAMVGGVLMVQDVELIEDWMV